LAGAFDHPGDAEIAQQAVALAVDQNIAGLHIAMNHALRMGIVQGGADLSEDGADLGKGQGLPPQEFGQGSPLNVAHHDIGVAIAFAVVMHGQDAGMLQAGDDSGFALEAVDEIRIACVMTGEDLQSDVAIHAGLVGLVYSRHAALAQRFDDPILTELLPCEVFHDVSWLLSTRQIQADVRDLFISLIVKQPNGQRGVVSEVSSQCHGVHPVPASDFLAFSLRRQ
jgi:hypothetical protein